MFGLVGLCDPDKIENVEVVDHPIDNIEVLEIQDISTIDNPTFLFDLPGAEFEIEYIDSKEGFETTEKKNISYKRETFGNKLIAFVPEDTGSFVYNQKLLKPADYFLKYVPESLMREVSECTNFYAKSSRRRFYEFRTNLHFVNCVKGQQYSNPDKFLKIRPLDSILSRCRRVPVEEEVFVDDTI